MGKGKKHLRPCPALGREITPAECGSGRGSLYRCPAECPFFPFTPANYEKHGEIEHRLIHKAFARAAQALPPAEGDSLMRAFDAAEDADEGILTNHARFAWIFHMRRDLEGLTLGERWLADRNSGLTNDERVLLAGMNEMHPALIEIQRLVDEQTIEGVDLLTGQRLRIVDLAVAGAALRYAVLLGWVYPMAHYDRSSGSAAFVEEIEAVPSEEVVREVIRHLGGPAGGAGERAWLSEHFVQVTEALNAVKLARWHDAMTAIDARYIKTDYRLRRPKQFSSRLNTLPDVEEETPSEEEFAQGFDSAYVWLKETRSPESDQLDLPLTGPAKVGNAPLVLGRILMGGERVRVEAMTGARHQELRKRFERFAAGEVEFLGERTDDLGAQVSAGHAGKFKPELVPPRLREHPQQLTLATHRVPLADDGITPSVPEAVREQYAIFADEPLPILDGQTPRAASGNPKMRPRLVALMKSHIRQVDRQRREEGLDFDLNPLLATLGLQELISEPPPLGPADDVFEEDDLELEAEEAFEQLTALSRDLAPHPVRPPLSKRELEQRLKEVITSYPEHDDAANAVDETFPGLLDLTYEATYRMLDDNEGSLLEVLLVRACLLLGPLTPPGPALDHDRILREFGGEFAQASKSLFAQNTDSVIFERWVSGSPQPLLMQYLASTLFTVIEKLKRKERPHEESVLLMLACTKAVVAELSRADLE